MKILIVGGGGREHALAWKLSSSPRVSALYACPGSDAISSLATCVPMEGHEALADFVEREGIGFTVVGPEVYLVEGLADLFHQRGLRIFGPSKAAAQLEGSKVFAKQFMERHGIPTASFAAFDSVEAARAHVAGREGPLVIKADGLAAGKGVIICKDAAEAEAALDTVMVKKAFGDSGEQVVIESFLRGEEASYFAICDGKDFISFPSAQDHKPVGDLDRGPNTGGMGAYCPAPVVTAEVERRVIDEIVRPTLAGMAADGNPYSGVLYVGLMIEEGVPRVVEFNCRFGDPETQPQMMMLESDLLELLEAAADGKAGSVKPRWRSGTAACIVMASGGYPASYETGFPIAGLENLEGLEEAEGLEDSRDCRVFHAGTARRNGRWVNTGGRVLGVTAWGEDLSAALRTGYRTVEGIAWEGAIHRKDIGLKGLKIDRGDRPAVNVGLLLGSVSDKKVAESATAVLDKLGLGYEMAVASAHRTPERTRRFVRACEEAGAEVFIAIAGMAAALPGVVAAETLFPVIGVPVKSAAFEGLDALLSIVQMPPGIPVAAVAVEGGANAALLAAQMLALKYPDVGAALREYRLEQALKVEEAHREAGLSKLV